MASKKIPVFMHVTKSLKREEHENNLLIKITGKKNLDMEGYRELRKRSLLSSQSEYTRFSINQNSSNQLVCLSVLPVA